MQNYLLVLMLELQAMTFLYFHFNHKYENTRYFFTKRRFLKNTTITLAFLHLLAIMQSMQEERYAPMVLLGLAIFSDNAILFHYREDYYLGTYYLLSSTLLLLLLLLLPVPFLAMFTVENAFAGLVLGLATYGLTWLLSKITLSALEDANINITKEERETVEQIADEPDELKGRHGLKHSLKEFGYTVAAGIIVVVLLAFAMTVMR